MFTTERWIYLQTIVTLGASYDDDRSDRLQFHDRDAGRAALRLQDSQPSFPIRAAFYYPWFPQAWNQQGFNPFTNYTPISRFLRLPA